MGLVSRKKKNSVIKKRKKRIQMFYILIMEGWAQYPVINLSVYLFAY